MNFTVNINLLLPSINLYPNNVRSPSGSRDYEYQSALSLAGALRRDGTPVQTKNDYFPSITSTRK